MNGSSNSEHCADGYEVTSDWLHPFAALSGEEWHFLDARHFIMQGNLRVSSCCCIRRRLAVQAGRRLHNVLRTNNAELIRVLWSEEECCTVNFKVIHQKLLNLQ